MTAIQDLDGERWPDPTDTDTELVRRCHALRQKNLGDFTVEDLRIMLGQHIAVAILLPLAVKVLVKTPLAEGDYYAGDLLHVVVRLPDPAWREIRNLRLQLANAVAPLTTADDVDEPLRSAIRTFVVEPRRR